MTDSNGEIWLYDAGTWRRAPDPINWESNPMVHEQYAEAGYAEHDGGPFLSLIYPGDGSCVVGLSLWVRDESPQCIIDIEGTDDATRSVYVNRFPDALDLVARWAPLVQVTMAAGPARREALDAAHKLEAEHRARRQR
jgi:hypothetical protein